MAWTGLKQQGHFWIQCNRGRKPVLKPGLQGVVQEVQWSPVSARQIFLPVGSMAHVMIIGNALRSRAPKTY